MNKIYLDFETRSLADLKAVGAAKYAADPSTDVLCLGVGTNIKDDWFTPICALKGFMKDSVPLMHFKQLRDYAKDPKTIFISHGIFDVFIWAEQMVKKYGYPEIPIERWRCTMAKCYAHGLGGSLKEAAIALNLPIRKDMEGRDNMLSLSKPRKNGTFWTPQDKPEAFEKLYEYCKTDVEVMRLIDETLPDLTAKEQRIWHIDQRINQEGIHVDVPLIRMAIDLANDNDEIRQRSFQQITGGIPNDSRQRAKLLKWLHEKGIEVANTQKSTLAKLVETDLPDEIKTVIEICISSGKTSLAKYSKMLERADENGVIREILQYHGAHTGRWAGRGIQIQNFPRETVNSNTVLEVVAQADDELFSMFYTDTAGALSSMLRKVIIAPEGHTFYGADFSQIEARVLAWLAGQKSKLEAYERGEDLYCQAATSIFGKKVEKSDKAERQVGKVAELALGFGGGIGAFVTMSAAYNIDISPLYESMWKKANPWEKQKAEESLSRYKGIPKPNTVTKEVALTADLIKQRWRNANKAIVDYWERVEGAARMAIKNEGLSIKQLYTVNRLPGGARFLQCRLPSGRVFSYLNPSLNGNAISYNAPKYGKQTTYGGELVENIVQAVARDILAEAMVRLEGYFPTSFTVHDEVISVSQTNTERSYREFERIMLETPIWAKGLPIDVECWKGIRYGK